MVIGNIPVWRNSKGRSGRIAHLTFRRTKKILNTNESVRN